MAECEVCHKSPVKDSIAVFRVNPKGEPGIFRCEACLAQPVSDPVLRDIVHTIEDDNRGRA